MRSLVFLVPDFLPEVGGFSAELATVELAKSICPTTLVTYEKRVEGVPFLEDFMPTGPEDDRIYIISWGLDIENLCTRLKGKNVVYHAHSFGYEVKLTTDLPIICVSRHTMGLWGRKSPESLLFHLPNCIHPPKLESLENREVDVLVQARKSSFYLRKQLLPELEKHCRVRFLDHWVDNLQEEFYNAKIYLYDSSETWIRRNLTEGFGLPPMEALMRGCIVFSSVNDALADFIDPGFNAHKLRCHSCAYDVARILKELASWENRPVDPSIGSEHHSDNVCMRLESILKEINFFFDHKSTHPADIAETPIPDPLWRPQAVKLYQVLRNRFLDRFRRNP